MAHCTRRLHAQQARCIAYAENLAAGPAKKVSTATVIHRRQRHVNGKLFFIRQTADGNGTLMVREADGSERVLLDPATLKDQGANPSITVFMLSPDGSKVAVNIAGLDPHGQWRARHAAAVRGGSSRIRRDLCFPGCTIAAVSSAPVVRVTGPRLSPGRRIGSV